MAILGLLREGPKHGYELSRRLVELGFWRISFGSIYPALRRLKEAGLVEDAAGRSRRKVYTITQAGVTESDRVLDDRLAPVDNSSEFRIRLAFLRFVSRRSRSVLLLRRRDVLEKRLGLMRETLGAVVSGERSLDRFAQAELEHRSTVTRAEIDSLDTLLKEEEEMNLKATTP